MQWSIYLVLCLSHSDKSCQSIKNSKASYCSPEGSKGAVQHDTMNWVASKLPQRRIVASYKWLGLFSHWLLNRARFGDSRALLDTACSLTKARSTVSQLCSYIVHVTTLQGP